MAVRARSLGMGLPVDAERILGLAQQDDEAGDGGAEPQRQGQEQRGQQGQADAFQAGHAAERDGVEGGLPTGHAHEGGGQEDDPAAGGDVGDHRGGAASAALPELQRLHRHGQRRLGGNFHRIAALQDLIEGHARRRAKVEEAGAIAHVLESRAGPTRRARRLRLE
jgi:hypothetical protein